MSPSSQLRDAPVVDPQVPTPPPVGPLGDVERDVRARRPPALSFLLRWVTVRRLGRIASLLALDFAGLFGAILLALCLKAAIRDDWNPSESFQEARETVSFGYLVTVLLFARSGLYAERGQRAGLSVIVASLFQTTLVTLIFALVNGEQFASYYIFWGSLAFAIVLIGALRTAYERLTGVLLRAAGYHRRAVLVGTGHHIEAVAHALADAPEGDNIDVRGFVSLTPRPDNGLRSLGTVEEIERIIAEHRLDEVIIADPDFPEDIAVELVDRAHQRGVRVRVAPSTMGLLMHRGEFVPGQTVPLFELTAPVFDGVDFAVKRTLDVVVSGLLLLVLSPLLAVIAVAVWSTSRGGIVYRSVRPGIGGRPFACLKFRTMYDDADRRQADLEASNEADGALFKIREDPRITPVGRWLRRYSLDELLQLGNVVRGEMSLVGPRPLTQRDYDRLEEWHKKRYLVLPGMTGLWQVSGRSELDFDDLVRLDFLYLERWSPFLDLTILVKTVPAVLTRHGAF